MDLADLSLLSEQLAPSDSPEPIVSRRLSSAVGFSARRVVYLNSFEVERPLIVAVLAGRKDLVHNEQRFTAQRGDILILPAKLPLETTSTPLPGEPRFRSFIVELDPDVSAALYARYPKLCVSPQLGAFSTKQPHVLHASTEALQAVLHFARTLLVEQASAELVHHRMEDLLLALSLQHTREHAPNANGGAGDLVLAVRQLIRKQPDAELGTDELSRLLAVSPATLRRRLAEAGVSLRTLRAEERMALANALLAKPGAQVAEVALRCGYRSPSKFARQFKRWSGVPPSDVTA